ncbi:MAG: hypothetical protein JSV50_07385 [Desulfobacteraceae bacterium]|nr:MAG: hypothetical protein JSV50_07385 [Desulfobacteraceae bacterium]
MGHGDLFFKSRITKNIQSSWHAPWAINRGGEQAEKATSFLKIPFWGCSELNFRANLPFDGMRPAYAAFEKEIPMALQSTVGFFKTLKFYKTYCNHYFSRVNIKHPDTSVKRIGRACAVQHKD